MTLEVVVRPRDVYCQQKHLLHDFWWLFQDGRRAEIAEDMGCFCLHAPVPLSLRGHQRVRCQNFCPHSSLSHVVEKGLKPLPLLQG